MNKKPSHKNQTPRQQEIIDRALELVREAGLGQLTTRGIASRVGFSEAALFRHFSSKQALLLALMDRLHEILVAPIQAISTDDSLPVPERLERIIRHHTRVVRDFDSLPITLLAEASASGDPVLVDHMRTIFESYLSVLEGVVREGQTRGEIVDDVQSDCLALMLLGGPAALAIRHRLLPDASMEDRFENSLIPFLRSHIECDKGRTS